MPWENLGNGTKDFVFLQDLGKAVKQCGISTLSLGSSKCNSG